MSNGLSFTERLRAASKKEHNVSNGLVAARLVLTTTDTRLWAKALGCFWHILSGIEDAITASDSPDLQALKEILPRVQRKRAYEEDLTTFYGAEFKRRAGIPSDSVKTYLERIQIIAKDSPHLLIAHAYTQHMAALAGGQSLRTSVRRSLQISPQDPGTAVFEFKESAKTLKADYKTLMDKLENSLGSKKSQEVIEEHRLVFQLNNNVIKSFPVSIGKGLAGVIKLIPVELLLILISIFIALFMMWYTRTWIQIDPDAEEFGDPDFVQS